MAEKLEVEMDDTLCLMMLDWCTHKEITRVASWLDAHMLGVFVKAVNDAHARADPVVAALTADAALAAAAVPAATFPAPSAAATMSVDTNAAKFAVHAHLCDCRFPCVCTKTIEHRISFTAQVLRVVSYVDVVREVRALAPRTVVSLLHLESFYPSLATIQNSRTCLNRPCALR
eukprot:1715977-Pleurochrysis_carterae.AAC.2